MAVPLPTPPESAIELARLRASVREGLFGVPSEGVRIGRYRLDQCIGRGGMGVVWSAHDDELDRTVAIKLLRPELGELGLRLDKEARALARLNHPNVVSVFDVGTHEGQRFIAMEFVDGETLRSWLDTPRALPEILAAFVGAGRGLAAAHAVGLVHRDFKPDNVLVGRDGRARVLDFGLARPPSGPELQPSAIDLDADPRATALSREGVLLGTPAYMAPEQHLGLTADARSDQFAFAVSLFDAVYGQPPFRGDDLRTLSLSVVRGVVGRPAQHDVPAWLDAVLERALAVDPNRRFADMPAMLEPIERELRRSEADDARFDTRQVEAVLHRAARLQLAEPDRPRLSTRDLESIAAEVGIDPALARRAALEEARPIAPVRAPALPPVELHAGLRTTLIAERTIAVRPSAEAMQHIATELDRTEGRGRTDLRSNGMTWARRSVEVHVDPAPTGARIVLWRNVGAVAVRRAWTYTAAGVLLAMIGTVATADALGLLVSNDAWVIPAMILNAFIAAMLMRRLAKRVHDRELAQRQERLEFMADRFAALAEADP